MQIKVVVQACGTEGNDDFGDHTSMGKACKCLKKAPIHNLMSIWLVFTHIWQLDIALLSPTSLMELLGLNIWNFKSLKGERGEEEK